MAKKPTTYERWEKDGMVSANLLVMREECKLGKTDEQIADIFGISRFALYEMRKRHPDVEDAMRVKKHHYRALISSKLHDGIMAGNLDYIKLGIKLYFPELDSTRVELTGANGGPVKVKNEQITISGEELASTLAVLVGAGACRLGAPDGVEAEMVSVYPTQADTQTASVPAIIQP